MNRRDLLKVPALGAGLLLPASAATPAAPPFAIPPDAPARHKLPDLSPARWIWYPSERSLPNMFVLFRRALELKGKPRRATGWIHAESRYLLHVNGERVQWGPAPCDPRWPEADPIDLTAALHAGANAIGATVLFYGSGDGTWPIGKPGFIFRLDVEDADGTRHTVVSDAAWQSMLARSWQPGHYKRWYLRALQEEFDARLYPHGWTRADYATGEDWVPAMPLECPATKPAISSNYNEYAYDFGGPSGPAELRARGIPMLSESLHQAKLNESCWITWLRSPQEYFELRPANAFRVERTAAAEPLAAGGWSVQLDGKRGAALTFELHEQMAGFPRFIIDAPAGTSVELMVQESHQSGGPALLNTHFHSWSRWICREGVNEFEAFDYECCRWIQLHIHGAAGRVVVREVGMRRRLFPWPQPPRVRTSEVAMQRLFDATANTLNNAALETIMDGAGRERQQYSGDCGHQLHALRMTLGEARLPERFLSTYSQGLMLDGYFTDSWPAYDRLARLSQRQLGLTHWGPILDHSIGFVFDCWLHYLHTGDLESVREPYPRLLRFANYVANLAGPDHLMPVENIGTPSVWIDHDAYRKQSHKQCAFNLYAAAMLRYALAPLCAAFGEAKQADEARQLGIAIERAVAGRFWDPGQSLFVVNRPWLADEKEPLLCDRSLATAILFDQCPGGRTARAVETLVARPANLGLSYPANAAWRFWALAKGGKPGAILREWRERWATMESVRLNNALGEHWAPRADSTSEWSHCPVAPLFITHMGLAGIQPLEPGFKRYEVRPQLGDLESLDIETHTPLGPIGFRATGKLGARQVLLRLPPGGAGELVVWSQESIALPPASGEAAAGCARYRLPAGGEVKLDLRYS